MKKLLLILFLGIAVSSCTKQDDPEIVKTAKTEKIWNLDFDAPGITIQNLQSTSVKNSIAHNTIVGDNIQFEKDGFMINITYYYEDQSLNQYAMGTINGHSFILDTDSSIMNICNGNQNVKVTFKLYQ